MSRDEDISANQTDVRKQFAVAKEAAVWNGADHRVLEKLKARDRHGSLIFTSCVMSGGFLAPLAGFEGVAFGEGILQGTSKFLGMTPETAGLSLIAGSVAMLAGAMTVLFCAPTIEHRLFKKLRARIKAEENRKNAAFERQAEQRRLRRAELEFARKFAQMEPYEQAVARQAARAGAIASARAQPQGAVIDLTGLREFERLRVKTEEGPVRPVAPARIIPFARSNRPGSSGPGGQAAP